MKLLITAFFQRILLSLPSKASRFSNQHKRNISKLLIVIKNQLKKLMETNFEKNGVFSKILFVKRRKKQKRQKRKKLKILSFFSDLSLLQPPSDFNFRIVHVFWQKVEDIISLRGSILMKDSFLETLLVVDYMKWFTTKFLKFHCQIWLQSWNLAENW